MYQTSIYSQFYKYPDGFTVELGGKSYQYKGDILGTSGHLYFEEPFWLSMMLMAVIGFAIRILSFVALYFISNPSPIVLDSPD